MESKAKIKTIGLSKIFISILLFLITIFFAYADSWTSSQPSHATLYADTITSKTDASSVNIADSQGLFVTGDVTTLGKVGIGTTGPTAPLQVGSSWPTRIHGDGYNQIELSPQTPGSVMVNARYVVGVPTYRMNYAASQLSLADDTLRFSNAPVGVAGNTVIWTERFRITNAGNVGIGTTNPGAKLEVRGSDVFITDPSATGNPALSFFQDTTQKAYIQYIDNGDYLRIVDNGAVGIVQKSGKVGIGTTDPKVTLDVNGYINSPGLSKSIAATIAHGHLSGASRDDVSVIVLDYTASVVDFASADAYCETNINSGWHACGVVKTNYFTQPCDTTYMISSYEYITFIKTESISSYASYWNSCASTGRAYVACSTICPNY